MSNRRTAVADELRSLLNGAEGANLVRQQQLADLANRAYTIGFRWLAIRRTSHWYRTWRRRNG